MSQTSLKGSILVLMLYDVSEEIRLEDLRQILSARTITAPGTKTATPEHIRFARPPVLEPVEASALEGGKWVSGQIKYYDYGVVSIVFESPFAGEWRDLVELASHLASDTDFERHAQAIVRQRVERVQRALVNPYQDWLTEDYIILQMHEVAGTPTSSEMLSQFGQEIAQVVRGETAALSEEERNELLQSHISYYVNDLVVIGWSCAFVYDTAADSTAATELLEYANSQLLEFRHYDEFLSRELDGVYRSLEKGTGTLARWRMAREATRLHSVVLEVTELAERTDNAIKFLRDMFSARLYRLAERKVGVLDYKDLVNQKLRTAEELYHFLVDQFYQGRAFVLELIVVIILIVELVYLFYGKVF